MIGKLVFSNNSIDFFSVSLELDFWVRLHAREWNGGISTIGVERSNKSFDVRFRLGVKVLHAHGFTSV